VLYFILINYDTYLLNFLAKLFENYFKNKFFQSYVKRYFLLLKIFLRFNLINAGLRNLNKVRNYIFCVLLKNIIIFLECLIENFQNRNHF